MSSSKKGGGRRTENRSCPGERYYGHVPRPRVDATATQRTGRVSRTAYAEPGDRSAPHARGGARSLETNPNSALYHLELETSSPRLRLRGLRKNWRGCWSVATD